MIDLPDFSAITEVKHLILLSRDTVEANVYERDTHLDKEVLVLVVELLEKALQYVQVILTDEQESIINQQ